MQTEKSNKLPLILLTVLVLAVAGYFVIKGTGSKNSPTPTTSAVVQKQIVMSDVAKHADQNSCWMVINSNVYDVTSYVSQHPGGANILSGCGTDATILFNNRPGGGSHSSRATNMLSSLQIGTLSK